MKSCRKSIITAAIILISISPIFSQSVGISDAAMTVNANAMLQIDAGSLFKGVMMPRVTYAQLPVAAGNTSLLYYVTSGGSGAGYYYSDGTNWIKLSINPHNHATLTLGAGLTGANYDGSTATTWNVDFGNASTGGPRSQGNFGQFQPHATYTDCNTNPAYWGWNYVQSSTNAPNATSTQWYRQVVSLGSEYPARGAGGYSLEMAFPRFNAASAGIWMRTVENGVIGPWSRIDAGGLTASGVTNYVSKFTSPNTLGISQMFDNGTSVGVGTATPNAAYRIDISGNANVSANLYVSGTGYGVVHHGQTGLGGQANGWDPNASGGPGVWIENMYSEGGGFYADGDVAAIFNPGDLDLLRIYDEDLLPGGTYSAKFDGSGNVHSPMMYDINNTAYYVDPAGTSIVNEIGWGNAATRTQTKDDAGGMGGRSGFYETSAPAPAANWPVSASSWWHLIDVRHSNTGNNYAMQFAGSFFDQSLYFRKTNNNAAQPWARILTTDDMGNYIQNQNAAAQGANYWISGTGMAGNTNIATIGNHPTYGAGYAAFWRNGSDYTILSDANNTFINAPTTSGNIYLRAQNNDRMFITGSNGFVGIGTTAPSSKLHVVDDLDNTPIIFAINTNTSAGTMSYGVRGECNASGLGSAGVYGYSNNSGSNEIGVLGDYSLWGAPVFGLGWAATLADMPASRDFGLFGTVSFSTGTGMYARNSSSGSNAIYGMGNQVVTGSKSASVPTSQGNQLVYSMESPEIWFEDFGTATLQQGTATIYLDSLFMETIVVDEQHPYKVFIQMEGDCKGLFVAEKAGNYFVVKEIQGGTSDIAFSYRIIAKRNNYQDHRFGCDWMQPFEDNRDKNEYVKPYPVDPKVTQQWVEDETRKKNEQFGSQEKK